MAGIPFDQLEGSIWLDGKIIPWSEAQVHVLTHGLHYGSSVFEGQRAYGGEIFKLEEHTKRLHASAEVLGFTIPWTEEQINDACKQMLVENNLTDAICAQLHGVVAR